MAALVLGLTGALALAWSRAEAPLAAEPANAIPARAARTTTASPAGARAARPTRAASPGRDDRPPARPIALPAARVATPAPERGPARAQSSAVSAQVPPGTTDSREARKAQAAVPPRPVVTAGRAAPSSSSTSGAAQPTRVAPPQVLRGLWVDAFGPGFKTPAEVDRLVRDARALGVNALFVQAVRRGDCYCSRSSLPRTEDPDVAPGFDPLADVVAKARAAGIQVHAWMIANALWREPVPPQDPAHAFNLHGPNAAGRDSWLSVRDDGAVRPGADVFLDPGHPDVPAYVADAAASLVRNYAVDGVQLDRIRYPDSGDPGFRALWGYNPTALERFARLTGRTDRPAPDDPAWSDWRRAQVTAMVRRVYAAVKRERPEVWVSAAAITYGAGPADRDAFEATRTYTEVLQDWPSWLDEGIVDLVVLMNYKRDHVPEQAASYDAWNRFAASLGYPGRVATGAALYLNRPGGSVAQLQRALATPGLAGWVGYSYRAADETAAAVPDGRSSFRPFAGLVAAAGASRIPASWGAAPTAGRSTVTGRVVDASRGPVDGADVELWRDGVPFRTARSDALGAFAFTALEPGSVELRTSGAPASSLTVPARGVADAGELVRP